MHNTHQRYFAHPIRQKHRLCASLLATVLLCASHTSIQAQTPTAIQTSDGRSFAKLTANQINELSPADFNAYQSWRTATQAGMPTVAPRLLEISRQAASHIPALLQRAEAGNKVPLSADVLALYGEIAKGALPPSAMQDKAQALLNHYKDSPPAATSVAPPSGQK